MSSVTVPTAAQRVVDPKTGIITVPWQQFFAALQTAAGTAGVSSFNTRTGAVALAGSDISSAGGALLASPAFTGTPTAPTAIAGTNTTQLATTAFVQSAVVASGVASFNTRTGAVTLNSSDITGAGGALLASPTFTGDPKAPTATFGDNDTSLATTAFVYSAILGLVANVKEFGAIGNGTADDTTAIQNAINSGLPVYFPPGIYRITSALTSTNKDLTIFGAGPSASKIKIDAAISGIVFTGVRGAYDVDQLVIENVAILSNNSSSVNAVQATWTASGVLNTPRTFYARNVSVGPIAGDGSFLRGFFLTGADNASISHCYLTTFEFQSVAFRSGSAAIEMISTSAAGANEIDISDCTFLQCDTSIKYNADAVSTNNNCQGLFVNHCHIINGHTGILAGNAAAVPGGTIIEPEVQIHNSFIGASVIGVDIQAQSQWSVTGNLFYSEPNTPNWIGLRYTSVSAGGYEVDGQVKDNTFIQLGGGGTTYGVSVVGNAGAIESILIDGNTFEALTNSAKLDANTNAAVYTYTNYAISGGGPSDLGTSNIVDSKGQTTPTVTAGSGTFTSVSAVVDYEKIGRFVKVRVTVTITTNGTAASFIQVPMPFAATTESMAAGRCNAISGKAVTGLVATGSSTMTIVLYDNTYPGSTGERITLTGMIFV